MKNLLTFILLLTAYTTLAQAIPAAKEKTFAKCPLAFTENKGQITDQYGHTRHDIQYKTGSAGMSVFIGSGQLHYQWSKALTKRKLLTKNIHSLRDKPDTTPTQYSMYRLDMALQGANPNAQVITADKQAFYENYHTTALHSGNTRACTYNKITYKNIYPHIDWTLYIKDNKLEYDFIVNPGGDVKDIKIKYNGANDIVHTDGSIKITTPLGDINEQNLYAYEQTTNKPITAQYTCRNNTFGFALTTHDLRLSLRSMNQPNTIIIDPSIAWGTYFGGGNLDEANGTACDLFGDVYITGTTKSISNIATTGSYQTAFVGLEDAFLAKFNSSTGNILWATYYGGNGQNAEYGMTCDKTGNTYITGYTYSTDGIATPGAYQTSYVNGGDAYLAKFDSTGSIRWGTYYGDGGASWGVDVVCDTLGNVYMCGVTGSPTGIATPGCFQDTIGTTMGNAFLGKFSTDGILLWGTYFGGGGNGDVALACICDKAQNIYIAGQTHSNNIHTTPGVYEDSPLVLGGGYDCFIAKFDGACHLIWSTYYGGEGSQVAQGIACDDSLNVYITGGTVSANDIATPGAYQTVYSGGLGDAFLAKFNDTGAIVWATYYGGTGDDEGQAVACDNLGNIFITGFTNSANGIATPGGTYDTYMGGVDEVYLAKFSNSGSLLWGTYYGDSNNNTGYAVACDPAGNAYLAGTTECNANIATPGSYQDTYAGDGDAFLVKFDTAAPSAVIQIQQIIEVQLFPSPNSGNFTVSGKCANTCDTVTIEIFSMTGQLVCQDMANIQAGQLYKQINLTRVASGDYLMKWSMAGESGTIKFTIQY